MIDVTRSMMQSGNVSNRTLALLEQERIKYQFFADLSREIQFEYTAHTDTLMLSEWGASQLGLPSFIENPNGNPELLRVMVRRDMESLRNLILSASPKDPKVSGHYLLNVNGTAAGTSSWPAPFGWATTPISSPGSSGNASTSTTSV